MEETLLFLLAFGCSVNSYFILPEGEREREREVGREGGREGEKEKEREREGERVIMLNQ